MTPLEVAAIASRLVGFAAAAVVCGAPAAPLYGGRRAPEPPGLLPLVAAAAGLGLLATLAWLMAQAGDLGDTPAAAFDAGQVWAVASGTGFGHAALARAVLFAGAFGLVWSAARWRPLALCAAGTLSAASFAWTGHGAGDEGWARAVHQGADVLHLVAASLWLGALAGLLLLALSAARHRTRTADLAQGLAGFSGVGVAVVAVIVLSGLANSWFLVGLAGVARLTATAWGLLLLAKLALFVAMLALAAVNRYRLTPRLAAGGTDLRPLTRSLALETLLGIGVLALVSWLGTLPPPTMSAAAQ